MKEPLTMEQRALAAAHYSHAENLADRRRLSCLPPEDRRQEAYIGLMNAARDFDPSRGVKFETFATYRIVGAIIDAERRPDSQLLSLKRSDQRDGGKQVKVESANSTYVRDADGKKIALAAIAFVSPEPSNAVDDGDEIDAALKELPDREWYIANRYLCGFATMKTTGEELGICESYVSQITKRLVERLRRHPALSRYARGV